MDPRHLSLRQLEVLKAVVDAGSMARAAQRLFMTATGADNVHNLALEGDFDGTQAILKQLIGDEQFRRKTRLAAAVTSPWTLFMTVTELPAA